MKKLKKGDEVIVIAGKDKGKRGRILSFAGGKVVVENVNLVKKNVKADPNSNKPGGVIDKSMPLDSSNVQLFDASTGKGSRVGIRLVDGERVRYFKKSDQLIDIKK